MEKSDIVGRIKDVIDELHLIANINDFESFAWDLEESVFQLEELIADLEQEPDPPNECGGLAHCIFCGERFRHGSHKCPQLVLRREAHDELEQKD